MSTLDIRNAEAGDVTEIVFGGEGFGYASKLKKYHGFVTLADCDGDDQADVKTGDVDNLILALKKAKELGW